MMSGGPGHAAAPSSGQASSGGRRRLLYTPEDDKQLSDLVCLTRKQIEVFAATSDDVAARGRRAGGSQQLDIARVGIRCVHCSHLPPGQRAKGSSSYPLSIKIMHQAVRNWQRYHFNSCDHIPAEVKKQYRTLKEDGMYSKKSSRAYWIESCARIGLIDAKDGDGIFFASSMNETGANCAGFGIAGNIKVGADVRNCRPDGVFGNTSEAPPTHAPQYFPLGAFSASSPALPFGCQPEHLQGSSGQAEHVIESNDIENNTIASERMDPRLYLREGLHDINNFNKDGQSGTGATASSSPVSSTNSSDLGTEKIKLLGFENESARDDIDDDILELLDGVIGSTNNRPSANSLHLSEQGLADISLPQDSKMPAQNEPADHHANRDELSDIPTNLHAEHISFPNEMGNLHTRHVNLLKDACTNQAVAEEACISRSSTDKIRADGLLKSIALAQELPRQVLGETSTMDGSSLSLGDTLFALGCSLYKHFAGFEPFDDRSGGSIDNRYRPKEVAVAQADSIVSEESRMNKRGKQPLCLEYAPLRDLGFPVSLCILVSSLIHSKDDNGAAERYNSVEELEEDLRLMAEDPERYLLDAGADKQRGTLNFPQGRLYGRDQHISKLCSVFDRVIGSYESPEAVLIHGYSGTGKTALVEHLREPLYKKKGQFVSGKFDALGQAQPMSVVFGAFNEYCSNIVNGDSGSLARIRDAVKEALGSHGNVLTGLIPNLSKVIGEPARTAVQIGGREALNRLLFYFRRFVRAISSPSHPIILFFDDLQWADKFSLELISTLVSDREAKSLLFVGCYRSNEIDPDHPLTKAKEKLLAAGVTISNIKLGNIGRESTNALISDLLHLSPRLTKCLARIVYSKTGGNPLFVVQCLRSLCDEQLLRYSACSRRWEWDADAVQSRDIADNVVDLTTEKISKLPLEVQWVLKVASCLGSQCEASTLKLLHSVGNDIIPFAEVAVDEGLMCKARSGYKFSHDQIEQAAYSLIPTSERDAFHLQLGRLLLKRASAEELDSMIFVIVDQLHRGSVLIYDHAEKIDVVRLCLMAGEKAVESCAYMQALLCLLQGSTLLEESDWTNHYDLCLSLFTSTAEAQFATGNLKEAIVTAEALLKHGRCLEDKLRVFDTHLNSVASLGNLCDAVKSGLDILAQLGEAFPSEPDQDDVTADFAKTRTMLEETSDRQILEKMMLRDTSKMTAMKLQTILMRFAYQTNQELLSLLTFRMVQMSLRYGVCTESPLAFASLGIIFCSCGEFEVGYQYGKLALSLLGRFNAKESHARVCVTVYGITNFVEPLQASLLSLKDGYDIGMSMGDINWAFVNANVYSVAALQWGIKLESLEAEVNEYSRQMKQYNNHMALMNAHVALQAILNLKGCSKDPTELTGEVMDQGEVMNIASEKGISNVTHMVYLLRMWLAYLFGRFDVAAEMAEHHRKISKVRPVKLDTIVNETFYIGLIAVVMSRGDEEKGWREIAYDSLEKLKSWAENLTWNFQHKLDLLNAEISYHMNGDKGEAAKSYDDAIRVAGEHGFVHEQALACERAGDFYFGEANPVVASDYLRRAHKHYLEWGATRKAEDLLARIEVQQKS